MAPPNKLPDDDHDGDEVITLNDGDPAPGENLEDDGNTPDKPVAPAPAAAAPAAPAAAPATAKAPAAELDDDDATDGKKPPPNFVPRARLNELTEANNELRRQNEAILARLGAAPAAPAAAPPAPAFDVDETISARNEAQVTGDDAKVKALDRALYNHQLAEAARIAREQIEANDNARADREAAADLKRAGAEVKAMYPQFDHQSDQVNPRATRFVMAERQALVEQGVPLGEALRQAAATVAADFGMTPVGGTPAPAASPTAPSADARTIAARARNAAAALAQPADQSGIGNRAQRATPTNVETMTDAELAAMPLEEIRKLDGSM